MKCDRCEKEKEQTFYRVGGEHEVNGKIKEIKPFDSLCLPCIKKKMKSGSFLKGPIITNPTIIPSGDPLEWVINED